MDDLPTAGFKVVFNEKISFHWFYNYKSSLQMIKESGRPNRELFSEKSTMIESII